MATSTTRTGARSRRGHQVAALVIAAAIAGNLGYILAQHDESVSMIVAVAASVLLNGSLAYGRPPAGARVRVFECGYDGCPFEVTSAGHDQATEQALRVIVAEHRAQHERNGEATVR